MAQPGRTCPTGLSSISANRSHTETAGPSPRGRSTGLDVRRDGLRQRHGSSGSVPEPAGLAGSAPQTTGPRRFTTQNGERGFLCGRGRRCGAGQPLDTVRRASPPDGLADHDGRARGSPLVPRMRRHRPARVERRADAAAAPAPWAPRHPPSRDPCRSPACRASRPSGPAALDAAVGAMHHGASRFLPRKGWVKRESGAGLPKAGAAPATVSGEQRRIATGPASGKAARATTRQPGDLPGRSPFPSRGVRGGCGLPLW